MAASQTMDDIKRAAMLSYLGVSGVGLTTNDLEYAYWTLVLANGGAGSFATVASTGLASDLTGVLSVEQAPVGSIIAVVASGTTFPSNPTTRTDVKFNYIGSDAAHPPSNARAGDLWDYAS